MSNLIFETIHGSHLYGLAHEGSDKDVFFVTDTEHRRAKHSYNEDLGFDQVRVGLTTFLRRVHEGSHQSLEALFSPYKHWHAPEYQDMIETYRAVGGHVFAKYERTIKRFCFEDFKRRRHAVRLSFNLDGLRDRGRFNPVMAETEIDYANALANKYSGLDLFRWLV